MGLLLGRAGARRRDPPHRCDPARRPALAAAGRAGRWVGNCGARARAQRHQARAHACLLRAANARPARPAVRTAGARPALYVHRSYARCVAVALTARTCHSAWVAQHVLSGPWPSPAPSSAATWAAARMSRRRPVAASQGAGARGRACATSARRAARGAVAAGRRANQAARAPASIGVRISAGARIREGSCPFHAVRQRGVTGGRLPAGDRPDVHAPATRCRRGGGCLAGRARARAVAGACAYSRLAARKRAGPAGVRCRDGGLTACGTGQGGRVRRSGMRLWGLRAPSTRGSMLVVTSGSV